MIDASEKLGCGSYDTEAQRTICLPHGPIDEKWLLPGTVILFKEWREASDFSS
jgi:hypothetical protein